MARAIKRPGQASDTATERVFAGNLKTFISQILTVSVEFFWKNQSCCSSFYFGFAAGSYLHILESCSSTALDCEDKKRLR